MALNNNKVIYGGKVLIDLTSDTVTADKLAEGITAHDKSGAIITGTNTFDADTSDANATAAELLESKTGERVFTFRVPLEGQVKMEARAGGCTDTAALRRVDRPNESYRLKKEKSSSANWV